MAEHSTNYTNTFISLSPDSPVNEARPPLKPGTVAAMQYERLLAEPYTLTSDELLFGIHADRNAIGEDDRFEAKAEYFSRGQACLRSSPLVKTYGWGLHHDDKARVALIASGSPEYEALQSRSDLTQLVGMRTKRA